MPSYVSFVNRSGYPAVAVYDNDIPVASDILKNEKTREYEMNSGSVWLSVYENRNRKFLDLWLSLYPMHSYKLVIKNKTAYLK